MPSSGEEDEDEDDSDDVRRQMAGIENFIVLSVN